MSRSGRKTENVTLKQQGNNEFDDLGDKTPPIRNSMRSYN